MNTFLRHKTLAELFRVVVLLTKHSSLKKNWCQNFNSFTIFTGAETPKNI